MAPATKTAAKPVDVLEGLIPVHGGGSLVNLQLPKEQWYDAVKSCTKTVEASDRNACDVELLSVG